MKQKLTSYFTYILFKKTSNEGTNEKIYCVTTRSVYKTIAVVQWRAVRACKSCVA